MGKGLDEGLLVDRCVGRARGCRRVGVGGGGGGGVYIWRGEVEGAG